MSRINKSQWGDIAQARQDRLDAFSKDLQEVFKKHGMSIEQGEFVFYAEDVQTRDIIGHSGSIGPQDASFEPYMHNFIEESDKPESAQNEPINIIGSKALDMARQMEEHIYKSKPLTDIEPGTTLKGLLEVINEREQALAKEAHEIFNKFNFFHDYDPSNPAVAVESLDTVMKTIKFDPIDFIMVDLTVERPKSDN